MFLIFCNKIVGLGKVDERVVLDFGYEWSVSLKVNLEI